MKPTNPENEASSAASLQARVQTAMPSPGAHQSPPQSPSASPPESPAARPTPLHRRLAISPDARSILVSVNPSAGARPGKAKIDELCERLRARSFDVRIETDLAAIEQWAADARAAGRLRAVIAAGGDGTVAEVANRAGLDVPLCVLPLGTENLFARYLGLAAGMETLVEAVTEGTALRLDVGRAGQRLFVLMASCGVDAEVVRRLHVARQGHISHWSYVRPILTSFLKYEYAELRVRVWRSACQSAAPCQQQFVMRWVGAFNLPCYAGGFRFAPAATATDGLLDLCAFRRGSWWQNLRYLAGVALGVHQGWADSLSARITKLRVEADQPVPYQLDGDPGGWLPCEFEVVPARLTFIVPAPTARRESPDAQ